MDSRIHSTLFKFFIHLLELVQLNKSVKILQVTSYHFVSSKFFPIFISNIFYRAQKFDKCAKEAKDYVVWLKSQTMQRMEISKPAYSFALMTVLKKNELARDYCDVQGIQIIDKFLEGPCIDQQSYSPQVCYNIICSLWILSYHPFAQKYFEDYSLSLIEKATKVLDFYSWEKIARILL